MNSDQMIDASNELEDVAMLHDRAASGLRALSELDGIDRADEVERHEVLVRQQFGIAAALLCTAFGID